MEELLWDSSDDEEDKGPPSENKKAIDGTTNVKVRDTQNNILTCQIFAVVVINTASSHSSSVK